MSSIRSAFQKLFGLQKSRASAPAPRAVCAPIQTRAYTFHEDPSVSAPAFQNRPLTANRAPYAGSVEEANRSMVRVSCCAFRKKDLDLLSKGPYLVLAYTANGYADLLAQRDAQVAAARTAIKPPNAPLPGPVYLFVAKDTDSGQYRAYLHFTMVGRDNQPLQGYPAQALAGRWANRLLSNGLYATTRTTPCTQVTETVTWDENLIEYVRTDSKTGTEYWSCYRYIWSFQAGCFSSSGSDGCVQKEDKDKAVKNPPMAYFVAYRLTDPALSAPLPIDGLPTGFSLYTDCATWLVSRNGRYVLALQPWALVIYYNPAGTGTAPFCRASRLTGGGGLSVVFRAPLPAPAIRMALSEGVLRAFCADGSGGGEAQCWYLPVAKEGAAEPLVLILGDDGSLIAYDTQNKPVGTPEAVELSSTIGRSSVSLGLPGASAALGALSPSKILGDLRAPKDDAAAQRRAAEAEYRRRLIELRAYLDIRGLLTAFDRNFLPTIQPDSAKGEAAQAIAQVLGTGKEGILYPGGLLQVPEYDPQKEYVSRLRALEQLLASLGFRAAP